MTNPKCLLMGCGGVGGILAASLIRAGHDLTIVTHNPEIAAAINTHGVVLQAEGQHEVVSTGAHVTLPVGAGPFDFVFLATQPPQVEEATRAALPALAPQGAVVCLQNGLCEQHVAALAGDDHTIGAIVAWGASMLAPGHYERTSEGGFVLGRIDGRPDPRLDTLGPLLASIGPVQHTNNLRGARWSKLAINCAISSLGTIGGERLGMLIGYRFVRRLALEVMSEAVAVARARGVKLEKVAGTIDLDWVALGDSERRVSGSPSLVAKHALLLAVGAKFRRLRSSMLIAIERGREPAVDFLNGEVVRRGEDAGVPVPLNRRIQAMIHAIARGALTPSVPLLRRLYADSRVEVGAEPPRDRHPPADQSPNAAAV